MYGASLPLSFSRQCIFALWKTALKLVCHWRSRRGGDEMCCSIGLSSLAHLVWPRRWRWWCCCMAVQPHYTSRKASNGLVEKCIDGYWLILGEANGDGNGCSGGPEMSTFLHRHWILSGGEAAHVLVWRQVVFSTFQCENNLSIFAVC